MNMQELYNERKNTFWKSSNGEKTNYIPVAINTGSGAISYSGTSLIEALKHDDAYVADKLMFFLKDLPCDLIQGQSVAELPATYSAFGEATQYKIGPDGITLQHLQKPPMKEDEYDLFIADPNKFAKEVMIPRRYPELFTEDIETVKEKFRTYFDEGARLWFGIQEEINKCAKEKYGVFQMTDLFAGMTYPPIDILFDSLRGFEGTLIDIRRRKNQVLDAINVIWETDFRCEKYDNTEARESMMFYPAHIAAYLNRKQFEEFYWPHMSTIIKNLAKNNNKIYIMFENSWMHLFDYFRDVPKNSVLVGLDDDDPVEASKIIGDWQVIYGGIDTCLGRISDKQNCLDSVKRAIDGCAPIGSYVISNNKSLSAVGDITPNLIAMYEFAHEYGRK